MHISAKNGQTVSRIYQTEGCRMVGFLIGCMIGGTVGVTAMCLCSAASAADRHTIGRQ